MTNALSALDISRTGLRVQRMRMDVIANNIANATTTRTPEGGPFRRQMVVVEGSRYTGRRGEPLGSRVVNIVKDNSPFRTVYDPWHPDANDQGYVLYPNIDIPVEMVNLMLASRAYEANVSVIQATKQINRGALDILRA
ncbi:MAG: flagellar basal body rod protein FlgC [Candidatus Hydrogenedentes bacterium]|nr:flagellar basal body rod protein FlgC [Candidatus Hydrogenedentota bacterium]